MVKTWETSHAREGLVQSSGFLKTEAGLRPSDAASKPGQRVASRPNRTHRRGAVVSARRCPRPWTFGAASLSASVRVSAGSAEPLK